MSGRDTGSNGPWTDPRADLAGSCQRWRDRRDRFRVVGEPFDPRAHAVDVIAWAHARAFVEAHHYSGTVPSTRLSVGLFRGARLAGVALFSVPSSQASIPARAGVPAAHGGTPGVTRTS